MKLQFVRMSYLVLLTVNTSLMANDTLVHSTGMSLQKQDVSYDYQDTNEHLILDNKPDKLSNNFELYMTLNPLTTYCKESLLKPYISITHSQNDELVNQYLLLGINKYYNLFDSLMIYVGPLVGYGQIKWQYDPLMNSVNKSVDTTSYLGGMQIGFIYEINNKVSFELKNNTLLSNYETKLITDDTSSAININGWNSIGLGMNYTF